MWPASYLVKQALLYKLADTVSAERLAELQHDQALAAQAVKQRGQVVPTWGSRVGARVGEIGHQVGRYPGALWQKYQGLSTPKKIGVGAGVLGGGALGIWALSKLMGWGEEPQAAANVVPPPPAPKPATAGLGERNRQFQELYGLQP